MSTYSICFYGEMRKLSVLFHSKKYHIYRAMINSLFHSSSSIIRSYRKDASFHQNLAVFSVFIHENICRKA